MFGILFLFVYYPVVPKFEALVFFLFSNNLSVSRALGNCFDLLYLSSRVVNLSLRNFSTFSLILFVRLFALFFHGVLCLSFFPKCLIPVFIRVLICCDRVLWVVFSVLTVVPFEVSYCNSLVIWFVSFGNCQVLHSWNLSNDVC